MKRPLVIAILLFVSTLASPAWADSPDTYEDYLRRAREAVEREDYQTALLLYTKAQSVHSHPRVRLGIARLHLKLGECVAAKANYAVLIDDLDVPAQVRQIAGEEMSQLAQCETEGLSTAADPSASTEVSAPASVPASPPAAGSADARDERTIGPPAQPGSQRRLGSILAGGGVGVAALGTLLATGMFVAAPIRRCHGLGTSLDAQIDACEGLASQTGSGFWPTYVQARNRVQRERVTAAILMSVGLTTVAIGVVLLVDHEKQRTLSLRLVPRGMVLSGRF